MSANTVTILLVEDNSVDVQGVKRAFQKHRIANPIREAVDGVEALEMLRDAANPFPEPYLILLDLNMPRMNGVEFLAEVRKDPKLKRSVVFVLTTSRSEEDIVESYGFNVAGYIVKSEVGEGFLNLVSMLDHYWRIVEFPKVRA